MAFGCTNVAFLARRLKTLWGTWNRRMASKAGLVGSPNAQCKRVSAIWQTVRTIFTMLNISFLTCALIGHFRERILPYGPVTYEAAFFAKTFLSADDLKWFLQGSFCKLGILVFSRRVIIQNSNSVGNRYTMNKDTYNPSNIFARTWSVYTRHLTGYPPAKTRE